MCTERVRTLSSVSVREIQGKECYCFLFVQNLNLTIISFKGFFPPFELQPILSNGTLPVAADRARQENVSKSEKAEKGQRVVPQCI